MFSVLLKNVWLRLVFLYISFVMWLLLIDELHRTGFNWRNIAKFVLRKNTLDEIGISAVKTVWWWADQDDDAATKRVRLQRILATNFFDDLLPHLGLAPHPWNRI